MSDSKQFEGAPTEEVVVKGVKPVHPYFEVQITRPGTQEYRFPFFETSLELAEEAPAAFPEGTKWTVVLVDDSVTLTHPENSDHPLKIGQSLDLDGARITLIDVRRAPLAYLHGLSDELTGRMWPLGEQQTCLGRRGKRNNHIELSESTVSRTHVTFLPSSGRIEMLNETSAPTLINGTAIESGERVILNNGDILGFGTCLFRFSLALDAGSSEALLGLKTMGTFAVELGGQPAAWEVTNPKARWLMGLLGTRWGEPISVEWLIGNFWPDADSKHARKNLGYALSQIRAGLEVDEENFESLVLRTTTSLSLNPKRLGFHDFSELKEACQESKVTSLPLLQRLTKLYQGDFLTDCYDEWAELERTRLRKDLIELLLATSEHFREQKNVEAVKVAAQKVTELEPNNQRAVRNLMEVYLDAAKPEAALEAFQTLEKSLRRDHLEPDTELIKLKYRAELGI